VPVIMPGVEDIAGGPPGCYRDGGVLDYHPVPENLVATGNGLVLYPHFYPHLVEAWFDKFFPWRKVPGSRLGKVVMVSPAPEYVAGLPGGRIPERQDFLRFRHDEPERVRRWQLAVSESIALGEEFLDLVESGAIRDRVQPLP
jgi:hypothetical protein